MQHLISLDQLHVHSNFRGDLAPALEVGSRDLVSLHNLADVMWGLSQHDRAAKTRDRLPRPSGTMGSGMALHGPIYVRGARPGSTLCIDIVDLIPETWGWTWVTPLEDEALEGDPLLLWDIHDDHAISEDGFRTPIRPFLGAIGVCPGPDEYSGWEPSRFGGNMDCALLSQGSRLYLPVACEGGLVSLGDGHAAQGHGEIAGSAIECRMRRVSLRFDVLHTPIARPRIETAEGHVVFLAFDFELNVACRLAAQDATDFIAASLPCSPARARAYASIAVDVTVTQMVNGVCGAHATFYPERLVRSPC